MKTAVSCKAITKWFGEGDARVQALRGLDLEIGMGELAMLVGPSGCGKTTLISIIAGLLDATEGHLEVLGRTPNGFTPEEQILFRRKNLGFVFQQFNLLPRLTAAENVALPLVYAGVPRRQRLERAMAVLEKVNLTDRSHHKPNELSGGQCQRVAIARALINNPALILADEPTGNLDSKTSVEIMDIFTSIQAAGNTVVLVTHEEDIANYARRIIRLRDGMIESDRLRRPQAALV